MSSGYGQEQRKLGLWTAVFMVCANIIGTGVFTSLGFQLNLTGHAGHIMILWVAGGLMALSGAVAYGELAAYLPRAGGEYNFLTKIYGREIGFITGWISIFAGFSAPIAASAMTVAFYFLPLISSYFGIEASPIHSKLFATAIVIFLTLIHFNRVELIRSLQNFFVILKLCLIGALSIAGFYYGQNTGAEFVPTSLSETTAFVLSPGFAISLIYVMFAYSGWNAATYIADEIKDPQKNLPKALIIGTFLVMSLYLAINASFLYSTPVELMKNHVEVALVSAKYNLGESLGSWVGALIAFGLVSALSSMVWAGGRVAQTLGEDHQNFNFFARTNRNHRPYIALMAQAIIIILLIHGAAFGAIIKYIGVALTLSSMATVIGLFVIRKSVKGDPQFANKFNNPIYKISPIVYLIGSTWIVLYMSYQEPLAVVMSVATVAIGYAMIWFEKIWLMLKQMQKRRLIFQRKTKSLSLASKSARTVIYMSTPKS